MDGEFIISEQALKVIMADLLKEDTPKPPYKIDKKKGEGKASKLELEYRQHLMDRYNILANGILDAFKKLEGNEFKSKVRTLTDSYIRDSQTIVNEYIPKIWEDRREYAKDKVRELGVEPAKDKQNPEVLQALLEWQRFMMEKNGETVYLNSISKMLGKNYFVVTYAK